MFSNITLDHISKKFSLSQNERSPLEIRDFDRQGLAKLFAELGFTRGVEVGVRGGDYSLALMKSNSDLTLYGVDPYEPHKGYRDHVRKSTFEAFEKEAHEKLDKYSNYHFIRDYSLNAVKQFEDNSLDFIYLDGDHSLENVVADIHAWLPKIRPGGIISGDDYFKHKGKAKIHVYQAVNAYTDAYQIKPWFIVGAKEVVEGEKRDNGRSWFWVKI